LHSLESDFNVVQQFLAPSDKAVMLVLLVIPCFFAAANVIFLIVLPLSLNALAEYILSVITPDFLEPLSL
jgi:hypothetical protein